MSGETLRFARQLYVGEAIDEAVKRLDKFATFELSEEAAYWVVTVTPRRASQLRRLCGELQNHALGLTIQRGGPP